MKRTQYTPNEKAKIVVEILQGDQTIGEIMDTINIGLNYGGHISIWWQVVSAWSGRSNDDSSIYSSYGTQKNVVE